MSWNLFLKDAEQLLNFACFNKNFQQTYYHCYVLTHQEDGGGLESNSGKIFLRVLGSSQSQEKFDTP